MALKNKDANPILSVLDIEDLGELIVETRQVFEKTFNKLHRDLENGLGFDVQLSGSTGTVILAYRTHIFTANVGDSRVISLSEE